MKRIPGTYWGCVVLRFTEDHTTYTRRTLYKKGEILCVRPEHWDNRGEAGVKYAGELILLHRLELVQDQRYYCPLIHAVEEALVQKAE